MSTAELNKKKLGLIDWINDLSDEKTIQFLDEIKTSINQNSDWFDHLSLSQKKSIEEGLKDIENNNTVSSAEFWLELKNS